MKFNRILSFSLATAILFSYGSCSNERTPSAPEPPIDPPKPATYTDVQIIDMVQKETLKYFWDFAEPNSKL